MKRMFITLATVVILSITLTAQSQSLPEANQTEIAAQENTVATSDSAYRSIPLDSIAVIDTNVDTVAKVVEIPLDTIIAQNIRRIKDSLPKYKPNKFSETMLRLPLIMSDYQPTKRTSLEEEIKSDYATSRLRCAIPNEKEPVDEQINQFIKKEQIPDYVDMDKLIEQTAGCLSKELLYMKFLQGIPVAGAIGGAYDAIYMKRIAEYSELKYRRRFYEKRK
jgi:hypothetical protein